MKIKVATYIIELSLSYLFRRPKYQSGENLVRPAIINDRRDVVVETGKYAPQQVSYHDVFILTPTVARVKKDIFLAEPMYFKEMMEHAHHRISTLAHVNRLINEVVDLAWYGFAAHSKDGTFPWGPWDPAGGGRSRVEHLLGHVE